MPIVVPSRSFVPAEAFRLVLSDHLKAHSLSCTQPIIKRDTVYVYDGHRVQGSGGNLTWPEPKKRWKCRHFKNGNVSLLMALE